MELSSLIEFKIIGWGSRYFDCICVGHETFESDFHLLTLAKSLLDEVGLTLQEDELATWEDMLFVKL